VPTQFLNATRAERSGQVGTPSAKTSTTAHEAGTQICALRAACARGAAWPPSSLFLCAATHGQALGAGHRAAGLPRGRPVPGVGARRPDRGPGHELGCAGRLERSALPGPPRFTGPRARQVLGLTSYSRWADAAALRRCAAADGGAAGRLQAAALGRLAGLAHVGLTERLQESVASLAASMDLRMGGPAWKARPAAGRAALRAGRQPCVPGSIQGCCDSCRVAAAQAGTACGYVRIVKVQGARVLRACGAPRPALPLSAPRQRGPAGRRRRWTRSRPRRTGRWCRRAATRSTCTRCRSGARTASAWRARAGAAPRRARPPAGEPV
jgi:hypothetical protein